MTDSAGQPVSRVGMLIPEFPAQTHAFFWREIQAWRAAGVEVEILSTRRPPDSACPHEWAPDGRRQTRYLFPPGWTAAVGWLLLHPLRAAAAAGYIAGLRETSAGKRLRLLGLVPSAVGLLQVCTQRGIRHVHCHSFANAAHLCALARVLGGPTYSLTLHGDLPVYGTDHKSKLRQCLAVTTAGPHLVAPVVALGFARERILSNPMGVDTQRFVPALGSDAARVNDSALRLITVARLNRNKGHRFALAAIRRVVDAGTDVTYTIVGEGPYRGELEREIGDLQLEDRAHLEGGRGEAQVLELLRTHDGFLLPSVGLGEAAPVSVMEAMACGLPVIASIIGSTPAMIRDKQTGFLVAQEDVEALGGAIRALAEDPQLRQRIGTAARRAAVERFDATASSLRLLGHLRNCGASI